jgi:signal transduction histidine kinase
VTAIKPASQPVARPGWLVLAAVYLLYTAVVLRTLANPFIRDRLPAYLALELTFLILYSLTLWRPNRRALWLHLYFIFQSLLVLVLFSLRPKFDFVIILFVLLSLQAALIFGSRVRWIWVAIFSILTVIPLMTTLGALPGLALALMPMTIGIVFPAYITVMQEIESGLRASQALLDELQEANRQLTVSTSQVEELSAIQERNRLARELHDSVSQTIFSITLHTRAAQLLLERDPDSVRVQLVKLQSLAQNALEEMRSLIAHLRPPDGESAGRPTP